MKMRFNLCFSIILTLMSCSKARPSSSALTVPAYIDLSRISGEWHIPARIPTIIDQDALGMKLNIAARANHSMKFEWKFRKNSKNNPDTSWNLTADLDDPNKNTSWTVSPFWPLKMRYEVIEYSGDYNWLIVGSRDRKYLWLLSRSPDMAPELLDALIARLKSSEFDVAAIVTDSQKKPK
jgi:apolipoprotein D and lipocalin family protein